MHPSGNDLIRWSKPRKFCKLTWQQPGRSFSVCGGGKCYCCLSGETVVVGIFACTELLRDVQSRGYASGSLPFVTMSDWQSVVALDSPRASYRCDNHCTER